MSKGTDTRERIVDQAIELAGTEGLTGLTIGRLAERVGMSKSGLFAHFRSKEELQLAVLRTAADRFREEVFEPALEAPRGEPRLRAFLEQWMEWDAATGPGGCPFTAMAAELDDQPGPARDALAETQRQWLAALARAARLAIDAGHLSPATDPELFAFQLQGVVLSYHHAHRLMRDPRAKARARAALDQLFAAHRPR